MQEVQVAGVVYDSARAFQPWLASFRFALRQFLRFSGQAAQASAVDFFGRALIFWQK
jgi:hypothetical protein